MRLRADFEFIDGVVGVGEPVPRRDLTVRDRTRVVA
jgi:hypothetical protein